MNVMKSTTEWLTRLGDRLKPADEEAKRVQAITALVMLVILFIFYIIRF